MDVGAACKEQWRQQCRQHQGIAGYSWRAFSAEKTILCVTEPPPQRPSSLFILDQKMQLSLWFLDQMTFSHPCLPTGLRKVVPLKWNQIIGRAFAVLLSDVADRRECVCVFGVALIIHLLGLAL